METFCLIDGIEPLWGLGSSEVDLGSEIVNPLIPGGYILGSACNEVIVVQSS